MKNEYIYSKIHVKVNKIWNLVLVKFGTKKMKKSKDTLDTQLEGLNRNILWT